MKKIAAALILSCITSLAQAHGSYRPPPPPAHHHHHAGSGYRWVAPLIIGGVIGYSLSRPAPVYSYPAPAPVIVVPPPEPMPAYPPPPGFRYEQRLDSGCRCWRWFVVSDGPSY